MSKTLRRRLSISPVRPGSRSAGFTAVELLVATVIMSFTLLGVYAVFRQALLAENVVSVKWRERAVAVAVADHLAQAVGGSVILPDLHPLTGGPGASVESCELECYFGGSMPPDGSPSLAAIEHRRYQWGRQGEHAGRLLVQKVLMAGAADIDPANEGRGATADRRWGTVPQVIIAENIDRLEISYRSLDKPGAGWQNEWRDSKEPVLIRIRASVGGYQVERCIAQRVGAGLIESDQEESP